MDKFKSIERIVPSEMQAASAPLGLAPVGGKASCFINSALQALTVPARRQDDHRPVACGDEDLLCDFRNYMHTVKEAKAKGQPWVVHPFTVDRFAALHAAEQERSRKENFFHLSQAGKGEPLTFVELMKDVLSKDIKIQQGFLFPGCPMVDEPEDGQHNDVVVLQTMQEIGADFEIPKSIENGGDPFDLYAIIIKAGQDGDHFSTLVHINKDWWRVDEKSVELLHQSDVDKVLAGKQALGGFSNLCFYKR